MRDDQFQLDPNYSASEASSKSRIPGWAMDQFPYETKYISWYGKVSNDSYLLNLVHPQQAVYLWYMLPPLNSAEPYFPQLTGTVCGTGAEFAAPTAADVLSRQSLYGLQREGGGELTTALPSDLGIPVKR